MAETHINTNKLDYQIIAAYERREQPDGSVLYVKYREEGENTLKMRPSSWRGEYTITAEYKRKSLDRFISINRTSTNSYYLTVLRGLGRRTTKRGFCAVVAGSQRISSPIRGEQIR